MSSVSQRTDFHYIAIKELHPTFGAEISGVDFSKPVTKEVFAEILAAINKVGLTYLYSLDMYANNQPDQYGVCVFRNTGLDDAGHIAFAAQFGELDDVTPYIAGGRAHRLSDVRLFDVGNIDLDGGVFALDNVRREWNKVSGHPGRPGQVYPYSNINPD